MRRLHRACFAGIVTVLAAQWVHAADASGVAVARVNHGNDPFVRISQAVPDCPEPLGPMETDEEWLGESHYRIERGNSCWVEGRCRLSNAYLYDHEIAESVQRRLLTIAYATHWRDQTSLWLMLQRRFIYVQGCVSKDFDTKQFMAELAKTADVDRVIDETTTDPRAAKLPYRTKREPDRPTTEQGD
jgi:hypothetical protein